MEVLARQHRQTVEKYEQQQENELRNTSKRIRAEQERELKLVSVRIYCWKLLEFLGGF
jgi:STE20-like kinase